MSTYIYLRCVDHDPPLQAEEESGQHLYDLPQLRNDIEHREEMLAKSDDDDDFSYENGLHFFRRNTLRFFRQHRRCRLDIIDEYGRAHPMKEEEDV